MSEIASAIAAAIEQQGARTQEISRHNVQQAARGTQQVSSNVTDVQRGAVETGIASSQVLSAAQALTVESSRLKTEGVRGPRHRPRGLGLERRECDQAGDRGLPDERNDDAPITRHAPEQNSVCHQH